MFNKKLVIEMLNDDVEKYRHYLGLYEKAHNSNDRILHWNNMFCFSSSLNARKQMCIAFGYHLVYDENEKIIDILPR